MANILQKVTQAVASAFAPSPTAATTARIAAKIPDAERKVRELEAELASARVAAEHDSKDAAAAKRLTEVRKLLSSAREDLSELRAAHKDAVKTDTAHAQDALNQAHQAQVAAVGVLADERIPIALELEAIERRKVELSAKLIGINVRIMAGAPAGCLASAQGCMLRWRTEIQRELAKMSFKAGHQSPVEVNLPGADPHSVSNRDPAVIVDLSEQMRLGNEVLRSILSRSRPPVAAAAPVPAPEIPTSYSELMDLRKAPPMATIS